MAIPSTPSTTISPLATFMRELQTNKGASTLHILCDNATARRKETAALPSPPKSPPKSTTPNSAHKNARWSPSSPPNSQSKEASCDFHAAESSNAELERTCQLSPTCPRRRISVEDWKREFPEHRHPLPTSGRKTLPRPDYVDPQVPLHQSMMSRRSPDEASPRRIIIPHRSRSDDRLNSVRLGTFALPDYKLALSAVQQKYGGTGRSRTVTTQPVLPIRRGSFE
jgi:hypothetical protein